MATEPIGYSLIGQPELSEQLMRALELKGDLPQYVFPLFTPQLQVDDWTRPEYLYLRRFNRYVTGQNIAAVAAQFSYFVFGANIGAGGRALAVVEDLIITNMDAANASGVNVYLTENPAAPGVGVGTEQPMDDRITALATVRSSFTSGQLNSATDFVAPGPPLLVQLGARTTIQLTRPIVLTNRGGIRLVVQMRNVNQAMAVSLTWRERLLLQSEL